MSNSTNSTSSDDCVVCPSTPACPTCADDEYCVMTSLTCEQCPTTFCSTKTSSQYSSLNNSTTTSSSTNGSNNHVMRIVVGSAIGGIIALFLLAGLLIYQYYWKPRRNNKNLELKDDIGLADIDDDDDDDDFTDDDDTESDYSNEEVDELTSLNDFGRGRNGPLGHGNKVEEYDDVIQLGDLTNRYKEPKSKFRQSMLTPGNRLSTTSTIKTNASNLLPIAYIPGVTSGAARRTPTSLNSARAYNSHLNIAGDTGSHITLGSSILGGLDEDFDDHSITQSRSNFTDNDISTFNTTTTATGTVNIGIGNNLTTAIKAKPKLVQISETENDAHSELSDYSGSYNTTNSRLHNVFNDEDDEDEDDEGSFILDLDIPNSLRQVNSNEVEFQQEKSFEVQHSSLDPNGSKHDETNRNIASPFDDTFEINDSDLN